MSTCLGETGSVSVVELFGLDRGQVVDPEGALGLGFRLEPPIGTEAMTFSFSMKGSRWPRATPGSQTSADVQKPMCRSGCDEPIGSPVGSSGAWESPGLPRRKGV